MLMVLVPNGNATVTIVVQPGVTKPRPEGKMIKIKFNITIVTQWSAVPLPPGILRSYQPLNWAWLAGSKN